MRLPEIFYLSRSWRNDYCYQLGAPCVGVLIIRTLPFRVYIGTADFWKLPNGCLQEDVRAPGKKLLSRRAADALIRHAASKHVEMPYHGRHQLTSVPKFESNGTFASCEGLDLPGAGAEFGALLQDNATRITHSKSSRVVQPHTSSSFRMVGSCLTGPISFGLAGMKGSCQTPSHAFSSDSATRSQSITISRGQNKKRLPD